MSKNNLFIFRVIFRFYDKYYCLSCGDLLILQPDCGEYLHIAQMAELVDALDSKSGYRKVVQVRFLFWAQVNFKTLVRLMFDKGFFTGINNEKLNL